MAIYRREGGKIDYVVAGSDVVAGTPVVVGSVVGIAEAGGKVGDVIALTTGGVFEFETDGAAINQGAAVYLVNGKASATKGSGGVDLGKAWSAGAAVSGATVLVKIG